MLMKKKQRIAAGQIGVHNTLQNRAGTALDPGWNRIGPAAKQVKPPRAFSTEGPAPVASSP